MITRRRTWPSGPGFNLAVLARYDLYATGTTGRLQLPGGIVGAGELLRGEYPLRHGQQFSGRQPDDAGLLRPRTAS